MANSAASLSQLSGLGQSNTISPDQSTQWQDPIFYASALQPEKNEIRLMTIQTGEAHEEIQVNLNVVSLDDNPQFETLSYVWGDPNITRNILLNGSEFPVTTYLYDALKRLRRIHEARIFWIDAICVNQQDLAERSSQVSLMVKIYNPLSEPGPGHPRLLRLATEADYAACEHWWDLAQHNNTTRPYFRIEDKAEAARVRSVHDTLFETLGFSRFFVTDKHSIGLGPWEAEVGDEIWIVRGGRLPLILRRKKSVATGEGDSLESRVYHELVGGDCYVDGILNGEAAGGLEDAVDVHLV
ncbi:hypothetical protein IFR05_007940 [Cadophora sp. M221]|nr:hypothetical protein IFR05_007940 [Cadophora sp. M221]